MDVDWQGKVHRPEGIQAEKSERLGLQCTDLIKINITVILDGYKFQDTQKNVYNEMGVSAEDANEPVFIFDDSATSFGLTVFQTFINSASPQSKFDVPNICEQN